MTMQPLAKLERTAALRLLVVLMDGPMYVTELAKRTAKDRGIAAQQAMEKTRRVLLEMGLIRQFEKPVPLTGAIRLYLELTPEGLRVAEHLKAITEILA
jgi:DNA-binding PadR family transcriptional regulator